ncbi:MAG: TlpA disulfide reductase family protein [Phycisphaerales bacterium]|nr:TlpA disulfide reductase family protein [Phycisphaerales bacterium]
MNSILTALFCLSISVLSTAQQLGSAADQAHSEQHAWAVIMTQLDVEERSWLLIWDGGDQGQLLIDEYLEAYPEGDHQEEAIYLKAVGYWNMYQYDKAAKAYARYLAAYTGHQRSSLAMSRHIQSLLRSDQAAAAIEAENAYSGYPVAEQRKLIITDAYLLLGRPDEARLLLDQMIESEEEDPNVFRMIDMLEAKRLHLDMIGKPLQAFHVKAWNTGSDLSPTVFKGQVLLMEFWASWCRPCMVQMPGLVKLYDRFHNRGFEILGIDLDEDVSRLEAVVTGLGIEWPQFNDGRKWDNAMAIQFNVRRIPSTILVDRSGIVRYINAPAASLERLVGSLLGPGTQDQDGKQLPGAARQVDGLE